MYLLKFLSMLATSTIFHQQTITNHWHSDSQSNFKVHKWQSHTAHQNSQSNNYAATWPSDNWASTLVGEIHWGFYSKIMKSNQKSATNFQGKKELMHNGLKKKERTKENRISEDSYHLETRKKSWRKEEKNKNKRNPSHYGSWSLPSQLVSSKSGWTETNKISSQVLQTWVCMRWLHNLLQMKVKKEESGKKVERKRGVGCSEGILFGK